MKKIVSLLLIISVICSLGVSSLAAWHMHNDFCDICGGCKVEGCTDYDNCTCSAANDWEQGTEITLTGQYTESEYTVTVPAKLAPGESGEVVVTGAWNSLQTLKVSCPDKVALTYNGQSMDVSINFGGIEQIGSDVEYMTVSTPIAVGDASAMFGTWTGVLEYEVALETEEIPETLVMFKFSRVAPSDPTFGVDMMEFTFEEGMTWQEWINSKYCTDNNFKIFEYAADGVNTYQYVSYGEYDNADFAFTNNRVFINDITPQIITDEIVVDGQYNIGIPDGPISGGGV